MRLMGDKTPWLIITPSSLPNVSRASSVALNAVLGHVSGGWGPDVWILPMRYVERGNSHPRRSGQPPGTRPAKRTVPSALEAVRPT